MPPKNIDWIEQRINYRFKDKHLLVQALTHSSALTSRKGSNERMEFLGDAILGFIASQLVVTRFPEYNEGALSTTKALLVNTKTIAKITKTLELEKNLILGKGLINKKELPLSILAGLFEAIVAAIYLDGGLNKAEEFVTKNLQDKLNEVQNNTFEKDYKSLLQDYTQKIYKKTPLYTVTRELGPDHRKTFYVIVEIGGKRYGPSEGYSKKEAEQKVAKLTLSILCEKTV
jgi:ribonuclease-3